MSRLRAIGYSVEFPLVARAKLLVKLALGVFAALLVVWFEAVRHLPEVKRRKHARRRARILTRS
jgi:hypothetical protein